MAKYERDFIVPYITDICTLHILSKQMQEKMRRLRTERGDCATPYTVDPPRRQPAASVGGGPIVSLILGILFAAGVWLSLEDGEGFWIFLFVLVGAFCLWGGISGIMEVKRRNDANEEMYSYEYQEYVKEKKEAERKNAFNKSRVQELNKEILFYENEYGKVTVLLKQLYDVNVIPLRYRDFYSAMYLYDWFVFGSSDDLDMALNTYVLEEIKERLDVVIRQQSEIILNERCMMALQYKTLEQQREYGDKMCQKLNSIQKTEEENLKYQKMIANDVSTIAFLAEVDYWRKL